MSGPPCGRDGLGAWKVVTNSSVFLGGWQSREHLSFLTSQVRSWKRRRHEHTELTTSRKDLKVRKVHDGRLFPLSLVLAYSIRTCKCSILNPIPFYSLVNVNEVRT